MSEKYHISSSGKPALCQATERTCPRGHYNTVWDARNAHLEKVVPESTTARAALIRAATFAEVDDPAEKLDHEGVSLLEHWERLNQQSVGSADSTATEYAEGLLADVSFGRHRGTNIVWDHPTTEYDYDDEMEDANYSNWDDQIAAGSKPLIEIYTRNGGGNRECYCEMENGEHDEGCTAAANEAMENHPLYVRDRDDLDDYTYASFYFRVPEEEYTKLRDLMHSQAEISRARIAHNTRESILSGETPLTSLLPISPAAKKKIEALKKEKTELKRAADAQYRVVGHALREKKISIDFGFNASSESLITVKEALESYAAGKEPTSPAAKKLVQKLAPLTRARDYVDKAQSSRAQLQETIAQLREKDAALTDQLLSQVKMTDETTSTRYKTSLRIASEGERNLHRILREINKYFKYSNGVLAKDKAIEKLETER